MDNARIERIKWMEEAFNEVKDVVDALHSGLDSLEGLQDNIEELKLYQESGEWLDDFEADERGELPAGMPRGVLSEDAIYNLLEDVDALNDRFTEIADACRQVGQGHPTSE